jgi:hypothetical protein
MAPYRHGKRTEASFEESSYRFQELGLSATQWRRTNGREGFIMTAYRQCGRSKATSSLPEHEQPSLPCPGALTSCIGGFNETTIRHRASEVPNWPILGRYVPPCS